MVLKKKLTPTHLSRALNGEVTPRVPFWFMRQAGRYLPEYRDIRKKAGSFLDLCFTPEYAVAATLQPIARFDMDAAILFSDILVVPYALGQKLDFVEGEGPRLGALQNHTDFENLSFAHFAEKLAPVYETVKQVRHRLHPEKALIGFAGAPWTVACYMIQGRGDGEFTAARSFILGQNAVFEKLLDKLTEATALHLISQIEAGADTVQLFDSWAGLLPEPLFRKYVIEPAHKIVARIHAEHPGFPVIGFPKGAGSLYPVYAAKTGVAGLSLDTQVSLPWAFRELDKKICLQGNLDPAALLAGGEALEDEAIRILNLARTRPFIFNLGHGVPKETPLEHMERLSNIAKAFRR